MHQALLYLPSEKLSLAELTAARIDGHLVELGEGFLPADAIETPAARAASIAHLMPRGTAAMGPSAAWVHGCSYAPPPRHHILRASATRVRAPANTRVHLHEMAAPPGDLMRVGPIRATTPLRTLCDLVRLGWQHPEFVSWACRVAAADPTLVAPALAVVTAWTRTPGKNQAMELLRSLGPAPAAGSG